MPLGREVGLGPGHIVLVLVEDVAQSPHFSAHACCGETVAHLNYF